MNSWEKWSLHLAVAATALTGLGYGWARYFGQKAGEFGPEAHPLQSLLQHAHVLTGPVLLFLLGMALKGHALPAFANGQARNRALGPGLILILAPMILSGYALQCSVSPGWRAAFAWIHGLLTLVFLAAYVIHLLTARQRALRTRPSEVMMEIPWQP